MKKNHVQLYNVIFPIWFLWLFPMTWIVVLPANFLIDFLVVALTMKYLKVGNIRKNTFSVIWKVWIYGFIADFIGTALMSIANVMDFNHESVLWKWWLDNVVNPVNYHPFESVYGVLWVTICVAVTAVFIYFFNYRICLRKLDLLKEEKKKIALSLAIFTAPYLFFLPTAWFY